MVKNKNDLTVLTVVENDPGLLELMLKSIKAFTDPLPKVIVCDNTNGKNIKRIQEIKKIVGLDIQIIKNKPTMIGGSNRHGLGLDKIFKLSNTKYTAIVESDVVVLDKDWHKMDPRFSVKASPKIEHLYHMCLFICETQHLQKNGNPMSFMPGDPPKNGAGYEIKNDVGWRICKTLNQAYVSDILFVNCLTQHGKLFNEMQCDEFYHNNKLIASHLGRGSNLKGKRVYKKLPDPHMQAEEWKKVAEEYIKLNVA